MYTLMEALYNLLSYITEDQHSWLSFNVDDDLRYQMNKLCTQIGQWLQKNK